MILLTDDYWEVKDAGKRGRGVYAKKDILPGAIIGDYLGKVIRTAEEDTYEKDGHLYLMYYHDRASLYPVDVKAAGVHLINHSCAPNTWMYTYKGHTLFFALRHIFKGEELTASYLLSPLDEFCDPCTHTCHCGAPNCNHSMHMSKERYDRWDTFNDEEAARTKKARVRYGYPLAKLSSYPKSIPDDPIYTLSGSLEKPPLVMRDDTLPSLKEIRKIIRDTGRAIEFPLLNKKVLGVADGELIFF